MFYFGVQRSKVAKLQSVGVNLAYWLCKALFSMKNKRNFWDEQGKEYWFSL